MAWITPVIAFVLALLFGALLVGALGWRHPRRPEDASVSGLFVLLILFPLLWAAALWITPAGPIMYGAPVVPLLFMGLLLALIIAVLVEPRPRTPRGAAMEAAEADAAATIFGVLFWILLLVGAVSIITAYVF